jgi:hypothetical protein
MIAGMSYRRWHPIGVAICAMVADGEVHGVGTEEGLRYELRSAS